MCNILRQSAPNDATWRGWHHKGQREAKGVSAWWKGWEGLEGEPCNPQAPAIRVSKFMPPSKNIKCAAAWVEQNWVRTKEQRCALANTAFIIITIDKNVSKWSTEHVISNGQTWPLIFQYNHDYPFYCHQLCHFDRLRQFSVEQRHKDVSLSELTKTRRILLYCISLSSFSTFFMKKFDLCLSRMHIWKKYLIT